MEEQGHEAKLRKQETLEGAERQDRDSRDYRYV